MSAQNTSFNNNLSSGDRLASVTNYWRVGALAILLIISILVANKILAIFINGFSWILTYGLMVLMVYSMVFYFGLFKYKDLAKFGKPLYQFAPDQLPLVSCMVAVFNEENYIIRCLESIYAQDYPYKEVIVVNDASTDNTWSVLKQFQAKHPSLIFINMPVNGGKKAALTQAMNIAKGQIFAHTDSDSIWHHQAISRIIRIFINNPAVGAVSGHGRAANASTNWLTKMQDAWMEGQFSVRKAFESSFGLVTCVSGPLAVFRRQAVWNYLPAWQNDYFLGRPFKFATDRTLTGLVLGSKWRHHKLIKAHQIHRQLKFEYPPQKWQVVYSKSAKSFTNVPQNFKALFRQQVRWKKSFIRNIFQNGPFIWRYLNPVALVYYVHILFVLVSPFVISHVLFLSVNPLWLALFYYCFSVLMIGMVFALALKLEDNEDRHWMYRPLMSLFSTLVLSWLVFYSALTIRKMRWYRG